MAVGGAATWSRKAIKAAKVVVLPISAWKRFYEFDVVDIPCHGRCVDSSEHIGTSDHRKNGKQKIGIIPVNPA